jgi:AraC-like DNA-binding protein
MNDSCWLAGPVEERLPLTDLHPVWVRHGVIRSEDSSTIRPQRHPNCEIGIWFQGEGNILTETEKRFHRAGDLLLAGPGVPHGGQITRYPVRYVTVHFQPSLLIDMGPDTDGLRMLRRFTCPQTLAQRVVSPSPKLRAQLTTLFRGMVREWNTKRIGREFRLRTLLLEMLVALLRSEEKSGRLIGEGETASDWRLVSLTLGYLREHYAEPIYSKNVASVSGLSESRLKVLFRDVLGMTWVKYLQLYRIHRAAALMSAENRNVTEAAFAVGFESLSHFNAVFHNCMGASPKQWLRQTTSRYGQSPVESAKNAPEKTRNKQDRPRRQN